MPSLNLYTSGPMIALAISTVTSEAAGFPIEYAFDHNPDTFWSPTTVADQTIDIDLGASFEIGSFSMWLRNMSQWSFNALHVVKLLSDDNDDGNYSAVTLFAQLFPGVPSTGLLANAGSQTPITKRYWRITYTGNPGVIIPEFGGFWIHKTNLITKSSILPRGDITRFINKTSKAEGGREFVKGVNSNPQNISPRIYFIQETDKLALHAAHSDSRGHLIPLVSAETGEPTRLVRFGSNDLGRNEISYQIYRPSFSLVEVPFIPEGAAY